VNGPKLPPTAATSITATGEAIDWSDWHGIALAEMVDLLYTQVLEARGSGFLSMWRREDPETAPDDDLFKQPLLASFWVGFDAALPARPDADVMHALLAMYPLLQGAPDAVCRSWLRRLNRLEVQRAVWFAEAVEPMIVALQTGLVGAAGQQEPVEAFDQAAEPVPFPALDDRAWRLERAKSRFIVLAPDGNPVLAFRRATLATRRTSTPTAAPLPETYRTGMPGHPTSKHLVIDEFRRRAAEGQLEATVAAEAKLLAEWLGREHPRAAPATHRTIENQIRGEYRRLRNRME
jgi:hypothetical protein